MFFLSAEPLSFFLFFFFNDTATTEIYTLSLHDALPISRVEDAVPARGAEQGAVRPVRPLRDRDAELVVERDRKSTRLNSSHVRISYAVFCLKKKKTLPTFKFIASNRALRSRWLRAF